MIGYALHQKGLIHIPLKTDGSGELLGDAVFATMVPELLPVGIRGMVVAGLLSTLMSSLASLFNPCATLFTVDIYNKLFPGASDSKQFRVGRFATVVVVICGIIWIPIMKKIFEGNTGLYDYLKNVQSFLASPITAVFLLGLFFKRINARGAFLGLVVGFVLGMAKLTVQTLAKGGALGDSGVLYSIGQYNGYYFSGLLFLFSVAFAVVVSLLTPPPYERIAGLAFDSRTPAQLAGNRASWNWVDVASSLVVIGIVLGVYVYFTGWLG
jgi:SSS family solute:Na+ symporter